MLSFSKRSCSPNGGVRVAFSQSFLNVLPCTALTREKHHVCTMHSGVDFHFYTTPSALCLVGWRVNANAIYMLTYMSSVFFAGRSRPDLQMFQVEDIKC